MKWLGRRTEIGCALAILRQRNDQRSTVRTRIINWNLCFVDLLLSSNRRRDFSILKFALVLTVEKRLKNITALRPHKVALVILDHRGEQLCQMVISLHGRLHEIGPIRWYWIWSNQPCCTTFFDIFSQFLAVKLYKKLTEEIKWRFLTSEGALAWALIKLANTSIAIDNFINYKIVTVLAFSFLMLPLSFCHVFNLITFLNCGTIASYENSAMSQLISVQHT